MSRDPKLDGWMEKWQSAQEKGIFKESVKPPVVNQQSKSSDYFGNIRETPAPKKGVSLNECDAKYWKQVYQRSNNEPVVEQTSKIKDDPIESEPQGKLRDVPTQGELGVKGAELGNTANPVEPPSRGEDQRKHVTPNWSDGVGIREIAYMKHNLYNLEVKINSHPKFGAYGEDAPEIKRIQAQIDTLRHEIDELSNSLSPDFVQDELS
jgi:hypothetical protein